MKMLPAIAGAIALVFVLQYLLGPKLQEAADPAPVGAPTFAWAYQESERDGIPYSEISITAAYPDGTSVSKIVDTIEGGCNLYEENDADV